MFCSRCGAPVKDNAGFCGKCGNRLNYQAPPSGQGPAPGQSPVPAPGSSYVSGSNPVPASGQSYAPGPTPAPAPSPNPVFVPSQGYAPGQNVNPPPNQAPPNSYSYPPVPPKKSYAAAITLSIIAFLILAVAVFFLLRTGIGEIFSAWQSDGNDSASASTSSSREASPDITAEETEEETNISDSELIDYFCQVALNVEFGGSDGVLKRWEGPIRVKVFGDYTTDDYATLTNHIDALNDMGILPDISIVNSDENFSIYFVPMDELDDVLPGYTEGNWGYFYLYWGSSSYIIDRAYMGIATDVTSQEARNHLILEEFTQSLGLMNDSYDYEDSIFQAEWTTTQGLGDVDYMLLYMLYNDYLEPGMDEYEVRQILNTRLKNILPDAA